MPIPEMINPWAVAASTWHMCSIKLRMAGSAGAPELISRELALYKPRGDRYFSDHHSSTYLAGGIKSAAKRTQQVMRTGSYQVHHLQVIRRK